MEIKVKEVPIKAHNSVKKSRIISHAITPSI